MSHAAYPPEPWDLRGTADLTVWRLPVAALPQRRALPVGVLPVTARGQAVVLTAFVSYAGGPLTYEELLAGVLVRWAGRTGLTITDIWVDSEASLAGGRALWGIPKEMADFSLRDRERQVHRSARAAAGPLMGATFRRRRAPSLPLPALTSRVVQTRDGRTVASPVRASGVVAPAVGTWQPAPGGPLEWLREGRAITSTRATRFEMRFGA